jgi:DNA-binding GntR family transcriptional regulator
VQRLITVLTARIVSGELPSGQKISEPELARELDASRGLVREAIRWLEAMEMVERVPNVGPRVTVFTPRDIIEFFEVREAVEGYAARLAATNMPDEELAALRAHLERVRETGKGHLVQLRDDGGVAPDFHTLILRGSRNRRLCRLLNENTFLLMQLWQRQHGWFGRGNPVSQRDHLRILEALENRDGECAEILMRRHIARLRQQCIERFEREDSAAEHAKSTLAGARRRGRRLGEETPARRSDREPVPSMQERGERG